MPARGGAIRRIQDAKADRLDNIFEEVRDNARVSRARGALRSEVLASPIVDCVCLKRKRRRQKVSIPVSPLAIFSRSAYAFIMETR